MLEGSWEDGVCKACGSVVEEIGSDDGIHDYMNRCTSESCINHAWHFNYDTDFQDYYTHKR